MNSAVMGFIGWPEAVAILVVVLILFGAKKLPELAKGLGQGIKEFKKASREVQADLERAIEDQPEPPRRSPPPPATPESPAPHSESSTAPKA
jgi:sec-independent protein translocase protein TatA